jgi:hypothetical protein
MQIRRRNEALYMRSPLPPCMIPRFVNSKRNSWADSKWNSDFPLQAIRDLQQQIKRNNLNITLISIEAFGIYSKSHTRRQLENLQVCR